MTELLAFLETAQFEILTVAATLCGIAWQELWMIVRRGRRGLSSELRDQVDLMFKRLRMPEPDAGTLDTRS